MTSYSEAKREFGKAQFYNPNNPYGANQRVAAEAKLDEVVRAYGEQCAERAAREPELEWQRIATELLEGSDG